MPKRWGVVGIAMLATAACTGVASWPERKDISIAGASGQIAALGASRVAPSPRNLMLCIVDEHGEAQCHHQAGVLTARVDATREAATCPGADVQLRSPCEGAAGCLFPAVPIPGTAFGLLVVELRPLVFGAPRHVVVDRAIVSAGGGSGRAVDTRRLSATLGALGRCLAPTAGAETEATRLAPLDRSACEGDFCGLRRTRLKLAPCAEPTVVGLPSAGGLVMRREDP
jgi:hypothetical protein